MTPERCERCGFGEGEGDIQYSDVFRLLVCRRCNQTHKGRQMKRNAMHNIAARMKISQRVEFPNEGTCVLDGEWYYYAQKKKARRKGESKYHQMRGFEHFIKTFAGKVQ